MKISSVLKAAAACIALTGPALAKEVVVSTVSPTTADYALAVLWSNLLIEAGSDLNLTVVDNGSVAGLRKLGQGKVNMSIIGAPHYLDAVDGTGKFKDDPKGLVERYSHAKALFAIQTSAAQYLFRTDSGVNSFYDLKDKAFSIGSPGGNGGRVTDLMLKLHGIDMKSESNGVNMDFGDALDSMANGTLDGAFVFSGTPDAAIDNASRSTEMRFVSPDPALFDTFQKEVTNGEYYVLKEVPEATLQAAYENRVEVNGPQYFWGFPFMFVVDETMPEEEAYELTKTLWEAQSRIHETSIALSLINRNEALTGLSADLHPGAARYFTEIGLLK